MSIYYILVNYDKKEFVDTGALGLGLKMHHYEFDIANLIGWLHLSKYIPFQAQGDKQYNPKIDILEFEDYKNSNFSFQGHWAGDKTCLESEHSDLYDLLCILRHNIDYDTRIEEAKKWVDISIPLAKEWNYEIKDCYGDSGDENTRKWVELNSFKVDAQKI